MTKDIIERLKRRMPATQDMDSTNMCEDMEDAISLIASQARRIEELEGALFWLDRAAKDMLTGIGVHNERDVGRPAQRIEGPVVSALSSAVQKSSAALAPKQEATAHE